MENQINQKQQFFDQNLVDSCRELKNAFSIDPIINMDAIEERIRSAINQIVDDKECIEVIVTQNIDKLPFGVIINPTITDTDIIKIIFSQNNNDVNLLRYSLEIDSKVFTSANLEPNELAAYLIEDVVSIMGTNSITKVKELIDILMANTNDAIDIRQSINYNQILSFGVKDSIERMNSLLYKSNNEIGENIYAKDLGIEEFLFTASDKMRSIVFGDELEFNYPKLSVLEWALMTYKDVATNFNSASYTLTSASKCTASVLVKGEINKTLKAINRALSEVVSEGAILLDEAKGMSIFAVLKHNGLRGVEDDLYEFKVRVKTCDNEDDAMYIMRQINTRISLLEDYINNTDGLSDNEIKRWTADIDAYHVLREELSKKSISKNKFYGVYVDYDSLDKIQD